MPEVDLGHIGVLMGGYSGERVISLKSGNAVYQALKKAGCHTTALDITVRDENDITAFIRKSEIDVAFIALHGKLGEDGTIQSILEALDIPYPGSGVAVNRRVINKVETQTILRDNNFSVPDFCTVTNGDPAHYQGFIRASGYPVVVKPATEGSSLGMTLARNPKQVQEAVHKAFTFGGQVLLERYIRGREVTVGILGEKPLPIVEIIPKNVFFDFEAKYTKGMTEYVTPAQIPSGICAEIQTIALKAHRLLGCRDLSRVDFMLDENMKPYILELNTIPGFTATSLLPKAAAVVRIDFTQLCLKLLELAYAKKKTKVSTA